MRKQRDRCAKAGPVGSGLLRFGERRKREAEEGGEEKGSGGWKTEFYGGKTEFYGIFAFFKSLCYNTRNYGHKRAMKPSFTSFFCIRTVLPCTPSKS